MVFARVPMFMIEQAMLDASKFLKDNALTELRLVACMVEPE